MARIVLVPTGGTIASRARPQGGHVASASGEELLAGVGVPAGLRVDVVEAGRWNGFAMTPADLAVVVATVHRVLSDPDVDGVVVTHGTDTTEETAFLLDLVHDDPRPVVLTGAQRPADDPRGDGPANIAGALTVAASPAARGTGVLVSFDGSVFAARGVQKVDTLASQPFAAPSSGPLGRVVAGELQLLARPVRSAPLDAAALALDGLRVDVVAVHPGADATALRACAAAGADGLLLQGTGLGNGTPAVRDAVRELVAQGTPVLLSTRVPAGPVLGVYGNGGGADLVAAGALPTGFLRPSQARVLLLALLGVGTASAALPAAVAALARPGP